ncbi:hypothetical protein ACTMU2_38425 [Cupriavidus basilensis]
MSNGEGEKLDVYAVGAFKFPIARNAIAKGLLLGVNCRAAAVDVINLRKQQIRHGLTLLFRDPFVAGLMPLRKQGHQPCPVDKLCITIHDPGPVGVASGRSCRWTVV